jgi:hypothetical protein
LAISKKIPQNVAIFLVEIFQKVVPLSINIAWELLFFCLFVNCKMANICHQKNLKLKSLPD